MARIEGTQNIPSELKYFYDGTLTPLMPNAVVRGRYPWKMPAMKEGGVGVSGDQKKQRARWKAIQDKFKTITEAERQRWYAAAPPWHSLLFYYNYFMMSGLMGNATVGDKGGGVIKSIQFKTIAMPAADGEGEVAITAVDPAKCVVMLYGNSICVDEESGAWFVSPVYPYVSSFAAELVKCKWSLAIAYVNPTKAANIGITVIEYI